MFAVRRGTKLAGFASKAGTSDTWTARSCVTHLPEVAEGVGAQRRHRPRGELNPPFCEVSSTAPHPSSSGRRIERCVRRPFKDKDAEFRRYDRPPHPLWV